ncbi:MAG: M28 family peptidase [Phycisphaerales bacterium]
MLTLHSPHSFASAFVLSLSLIAACATENRVAHDSVAAPQPAERIEVKLPAPAPVALPTKQDAPPPPAEPASPPAAPAQKPGEGKSIHETVNPYGFQPKDTSVVVDAKSVNLKQVFEDLGPDAIEWYQHVVTLSNPYFEGRCPGTEGHDRAVAYLEWWMKKIGLEPAFKPDSASGTDGASYRQPFELTGNEPKVLSANVVVDGKTFVRDTDYAVCAASAKGDVTAPLAFAGYGIVKGAGDYTSFGDGADLKGRVAILFRREPLDADGNAKWEKETDRPRIRMADKLGALVERGAAAIIVVNPPGAKANDRPLEDLRTSRWGGPRGVPVVQLTTEAADALVRQADPQGRDLMALRRLADEGTTKEFAMKSDVKATIAADVGEATVPASNVGGVLVGKGALKDEWIIVGGHFDHVGYGMFGTDPKNRGQLHPGADDNASGTAGVLVLAREMKEQYDAAPADANLRSVLFLNFSGEESGLDGSKWWVKHPTLPADKISAMLNMDMIGRLRNDELSIGGVGTAKGFADRVDEHVKASGLTVHADATGRGPSDHASFYGAGVPVLFFFTGTHESYHRPTDKGYTVNPAGAIKTIDLVKAIALDLADDPQRLEFTSSEGGASNDRGYAPVRLGLMPAMGEADAGGVKVEAVSSGTSAAEAGIKEGDLLLTWNGKELTGPGDMMSRLREHQPGDHVTIVLRRDGKEQEVTVVLKASRPRE